MKTLIILLLGTTSLMSCTGSGTPTQPESQTAAQSTALSPSGDCVETYNLETLGNRAFAFDGTVAHIADGSADPRSYGSIDVTFDVTEWFRGGTTGQATVQMNAPQPVAYTPGDAFGVGSRRLTTGPSQYKVGSRLLVTGQPRWGGEPMDNAIAWYCGFTRTHDEETATAWREAFR